MIEPGMCTNLPISELLYRECFSKGRTCSLFKILNVGKNMYKMKHYSATVLPIFHKLIQILILCAGVCKILTSGCAKAQTVQNNLKNILLFLHISYIFFHMFFCKLFYFILCLLALALYLSLFTKIPRHTVTCQ